VLEYKSIVTFFNFVVVISLKVKFSILFLAVNAGKSINYYNAKVKQMFQFMNTKIKNTRKYFKKLANCLKSKYVQRKNN